MENISRVVEITSFPFAFPFVYTNRNRNRRTTKKLFSIFFRRNWKNDWINPRKLNLPLDLDNYINSWSWVRYNLPRSFPFLYNTNFRKKKIIWYIFLSKKLERRRSVVESSCSVCVLTSEEKYRERNRFRRVYSTTWIPDRKKRKKGNWTELFVKREREREISILLGGDQFYVFEFYVSFMPGRRFVLATIRQR